MEGASRFCGSVEINNNGTKDVEEVLWFGGNAPRSAQPRGQRKNFTLVKVPEYNWD